MLLRVDTTAIKDHADRLQVISRSALPVAVKRTINTLAFDVKRRTMPEEAGRFIHRKSTFFQANSKVTPAQGLDIGSMAAMVGFVPKAGDKSHAVEDLQAQEEGTEIGNRSFIALKQARGSRSWQKMVAGKFTLDHINSRMSVATRSSIVDSKNAKVPARYSKDKKKRQQYIKSVIAAGKGGYVLGTDRKKGNRFLLYINSIKRLDDGNTVVNSTPIYAVKSDRRVTPDKKYSHFMRRASDRSASRMDNVFIANAHKQLAKIK